MDKDGVSDFSALIKAVHKKSEAIAFVAFDILHIDGIDLRKEPLIRRRVLLRELIPDDCSVQFSDHFVASGKEIFEAVKKLGLEGIVSKRAKAPYRSGPSRNWLKTKNYAEVELPILGVVQEAWLRPKVWRTAFPKSAQQAINDARHALACSRISLSR